MRNLADTIARLKAMRPSSLAAVPPAELSNRLQDLGPFGSNPGSLGASFYVPKNLPERAPLVVVLHGCTQSAAAYDAGAGWSTLADEAGFAVLYPVQQRSNNPGLCFNWFVPTDVRRNSGEALSIKQMIDTMLVHSGLDRDRVFVTGLSAGGAMASAMLASYPEVFAGGAVIAGLPFGIAGTMPEAFDRMRGHGIPSNQQLQKILRLASPHKGPWPKVSIWHGSADHTVAPVNAEAIAAQWCGAHGIARAADTLETIAGHTRQSWTDRDGQDVVELYSLAGMGHGTPLKTTGTDGLGATGAFMLEAGISSTRCIAGFWGIAHRATRSATTKRASNIDLEPISLSKSMTVTSPEISPAKTPAPAPGKQEKIRAIIEDALKAAGLMR